ncbi:unnamed protein product [Owenia fusiformis]|uniref:Uncharacterized protein n=1 Tax=Owenia fusiformis TaxID=6347 RepID=A0A8J1U608_OWEFU|nr:unnamed protein product [Owenia fusiformis]
MLTSSASQYLHPDYLQPLPTTLDAKKSPLALLAQTCSSIGKDSPSSKNIIPPLEKKDRKSSSPEAKNDDKRSSSADRKSPKSPKPGFRSIPPKDIPPLVPISRSSSSSPASTSDKHPSSESTSTTSVIHHPVTVPAPTSGHHSNSSISLSCGSMRLEVNHHEAASSSGASKSSTSESSSSHSAHSGTPLKPSTHPYPGSVPSLYSHPYGHKSALEAAAAAYQGLPSAHGLGLPKFAPGAHPQTAGLSPYVAYASVKTATGATTLVPICRDPYCTNCQVTMQNAQLTPSAACGAGCTQCNHEKSVSGLPSVSSSNLGLGLPSASSMSLPVLPLGAGAYSLAGAASLAGSSLPGLYPHNLSLLAAHGHPPMPSGGYVCNWMAGAEYCGKRFGTSEELLQHLRTHTSASESALNSLALAGMHGGLSSASALSAACHSHYSTPGAPLSPNTLRRLYPTSLSPNSALAAARYHPYKSALPAVPPQGLPLPGVGTYYSPYALYGQRLGAVAP